MRITKKTHQAVALIIDGLPYKDVARQCGISLRCLSNWRQTPAFQAMLADAQKELEQELSHGIANPVVRQRGRQQRWNALQRIREGRKNDSRYQNVPGGDTGLLRMDVKAINGKPVGVYKVDKDLISEWRALEEASARDFPNRVLADADAQDDCDLSQLSDEDLADLRQIARKYDDTKEGA